MANMTGQTSGMHAGTIVLTVDRPAATSDYVASLRRRDRAFWIALGGALFLHLLIIIALIVDRGSNRTLGTQDGANDAIAVEIVDGATLKDSMEPPTPETQPPGAQPQQTAAPAAQPQQPQPPAEQPPVEPTPPEPQAEPQQPAEAAPTPPPETAQPAEAPPSAGDAAKLAAEALAAMEEAPVADLSEQPKPPETPKEAAKEVPKQEAPKQEPKKVEAKKPPAKQQAKQPQKRTQTSALDLSVPYDGAESNQDAGSSSAVQRPPGITRSGENDEFARNVIRALQKTMPRERARGRVTVRILLNENGSRADVKLLASGGNPDLDFNVMFAARQTAYPFPPKNATLVDRTFTVTYIYR